MVNKRKIEEYLTYLVHREIIHEGQKKDVLNRGMEQARHVLLDKRNEIRRLMGRQRIAYALSEIELIASFRFRRLDIQRIWWMKIVSLEWSQKRKAYPT